MRTTVTLPDELVKDAKKYTKKQRLSEAVAFALREYIDHQKRLALLDRLFNEPVPHDYKKIKADRKKRDWVAD